MCFPKYNIDYFINKISEIGKRPPAKVIVYI